MLVKKPQTSTFCNRFKKGSKNFRKILIGEKSEDVPGITIMNTYVDCSTVHKLS
jgi:hypothetical protein